MINIYDILETIQMIDKEHLDIRTITMGISLTDCADADMKKMCAKVYDKICHTAQDLVQTGKDIEREYGIPIINKRISVTPISLIAGTAQSEDCIPLALALDKAAKEVGAEFIGGYSALLYKGMTRGDKILLASLPEAIAATERTCCSVAVATTRAGINMDAVATMGKIITQTAYLTRDKGSIGCAKLVVFANAPEDNPFMAGAFHGVGEAECAINVGVSGPGVVYNAIARAGDCDFQELSDIIKRTAFKITRMGQLVASVAAQRLHAEFGIVDISLAPTPAIGDSVARILEEMGLEICGCHGTTAALALLNDAVKKGGLMASSQVGGLSGAFIPVSEDEGMIAAAEKGVLTLDKLETMTAICSVGIDMVAVPGDTPPEVLSAIIADEIAIGVINNKTTAVRIIPVYDKKVGDKVKFGGLLGTAPIMPVKTASPARFIKRGGRIPAPTHSQKN